MITHYYECDKCHRKHPIVFIGYSVPAEHLDRLPDGWVYTFKDGRSDSYCAACWVLNFRGNDGDT